MSEVKAGVYLNYLGIIIRLATSFLLTPFILDSLGTSEYGLFVLSSSIIMWFSLADLGLGPTVFKYVTTYRAKGEEKQQAHFLGQSIMLFGVLSVLLLIAGACGFIYLNDIFPNVTPSEYDTLQILYLITLSNVLLSFPLRPLSQLPGAYQKFIVPGIISLVSSVLNAVLTIVLLYLGFKSIGLVTLQVAVSIFVLVAGLYYSFHTLGARVTFNKPDITLYKGMFGFSFWILLNQLMDLFYWKAGTPILTGISGPAAAAMFAIGISFAQYFIVAANGISSVMVPKLMHMVAKDASKQELTDVMIKTARMQLFLITIILLAFSFFGEDFLTLWVGKTIEPANISQIWLGTTIVLTPLIIPLTQGTGVSILQAMEIHKGRAIILFYSSLICVIIGVALSFIYGFLGMFIGTAISCLVGQGFLLNRYYAYKAGLQMKRFYKETYLKMLVPALIMSAAGLLLRSLWTINGWNIFFMCIVIFCAFCAVTLWFAYFRKDEKETFSKPIRSVLRKLHFKS